MAGNTTNDVISNLVEVANKRAAEYEAAREVMLEKRQATRDAANMITDLAELLGLPEPEHSEAVTKVLAKRNRRAADDDDE